MVRLGWQALVWFECIVTKSGTTTLHVNTRYTPMLHESQQKPLSTLMTSASDGRKIL